MNLIPVQLAYAALKRQKTRSILTILGTSIGIAIVIAIMAAGRGLDRMIMSELAMFSADTVSIEVKIPSTKQSSSDNAFGQATGITITTLKDKDIEAVARHPNIIAAYGWAISQAIISYGAEKRTVMIMGEGAAMPDVEKFEIADGRMYTSDEENSLAQVVVLGSAVQEKLFGEDSAVGKTVYVKGKPFRVAGVAAKRGSYAFFDMDNVIIMPTKTLQKRIMGIDYVRNIIGKMKDVSLSKSTVEDLKEIIRADHSITDPDKDDFAVNTMEEAKAMISSVVDGILILLVALVCISLVVGGVGIMNIMYVSVTERTFEIGLRKAVGAKDHDILLQFLSEAVLITLGGGAAGIIIGAILALIIYLLATYYGLTWAYSIPPSSIALALGFSTGVGLLFGIYPARKAANLNPIEALRRE